VYLAIGIVCYWILRVSFQLKAFGEEEDIPPWGVKVFGDKVIVLSQIYRSFSVHGLLLLSLHCLNALDFWCCVLQKAFPPVEFPDLTCCNLLNSFLNNKLNSVVELTVDKGWCIFLFYKATMFLSFCYFVMLINHLFFVW